MRWPGKSVGGRCPPYLDWASYPPLVDLFAYNGSGTMPGRTWVIAPDGASLLLRWQRLIHAKPELKEDLFHPHLRGGQPGDKHVNKIVKGLPGQPNDPKPVAEATGDCLPPIRYGHRSFDRQWIIPDSRVINQPNPELWRSHGASQVYLTAFQQDSPTSGPAVTFTASVPDLHHYKGSFGGRVFPLWRDTAATEANLPPNLLNVLAESYQSAVTPEDFLAYLAAVAAHPVYTARFQGDLVQPGLRIPLTTQSNLFTQAVELGRRVIWLHTFGERYIDAKAGRPVGPPRLPKGRAPIIPKEGAIPDDPDSMPDELGYDESKNRLLVGAGFIDHVPTAVWHYEVSGKRVLRQWFSSRKKNRERPIIGDRRPPSKLGDIQPDHWLAEYTTELLNVVHVLGLLIDLEPTQDTLLDAICEETTLDLGR